MWAHPKVFPLALSRPFALSGQPDSVTETVGRDTTFDALGDPEKEAQTQTVSEGVIPPRDPTGVDKRGGSL